MYQIKLENDKKNKKKVPSKYEKSNEEQYECVTCGFKVQKMKY